MNILAVDDLLIINKHLNNINSDIINIYSCRLRVVKILCQ